MSQMLKIQRHLAKGHTVTPLSALRLFGSLRLSERIRELEADGWKIDRAKKRIGVRRYVMEYFMARARRG